MRVMMFSHNNREVVKIVFDWNTDVTTKMLLTINSLQSHFTDNSEVEAKILCHYKDKFLCEL